MILRNFLACIAVPMCLSVAVAAPPVPQNPSPGSTSASTRGPTLSSVTPTFTWDASAGASGYGIYISKAPYGCANNAVFCMDHAVATPTTSFQLPSNTFLPGNAYRWQMDAWNGTGTSATTSVLYFRTPLPQVDLDTPTNGMTGVSTAPTLRWNSVTGASHYWITIATNSQTLPTDRDEDSCTRAYP